MAKKINYEEQGWVTVYQAMERTGLSERTIRRRCDDNTYRTRKLDQLRVWHEDVPEPDLSPPE